MSLVKGSSGLRRFWEVPSPNSGKMNGCVNVTVETATENQIIEIGFDGQEIIQPPLTLADHLAKQAAKVNFERLPDECGEDARPSSPSDDSSSGEEKDDDREEGAACWPWESTRNKIRDALTELNVLSDVMALATKECGKDGQGNPKRYMVLDGPVQVDPAPDMKSSNLVAYLAKKKSLEAPAKILLHGAEQLGRLLQVSGNDIGKVEALAGKKAGAASIQLQQKASAVEDFHLELLKLRQNWRLKKVSHTILGDLSYRTAGSQFKQSGIFEVVKADASSRGKDDSSGSPRQTSLKVNVPSDLEGIAFLQVVIQKDQQLVTAQLTAPSQSGGAGSIGPADKDKFWQPKLEAAQNVLFCKELFSQLAKEAIQLQAPIPHTVVGNQITASLFPDIQLLITLCHFTGDDGGRRQQQHDHSTVLEHSLHQLLRAAHQHNVNPDHVGLSTAPVGVSKRRRLAGPGAASRHDLLEMASSETLLERIIRQAQHIVLRLRTSFVLDTMARELKDPLITCHWGTVSSSTKTSVKVCIMTAGYETITKTQFVVHVAEKKLTVICKDGRVLHFSHEPQELRDFILCQIAQHQISAVQALAKCTGWQILSSSTYHLGSGVVEPLGNAVGCHLSNAAGDKFVAVRHGPQTHSAASIYVSSAPCKDFFAGSLVKDARWENLPESFRELCLEKMDGKTLPNKLELLMAAMSSG